MFSTTVTRGFGRISVLARGSTLLARITCANALSMLMTSSPNRPIIGTISPPVAFVPNAALPVPAALGKEIATVAFLYPLPEAAAALHGNEVRTGTVRVYCHFLTRSPECKGVGEWV